MVLKSALLGSLFMFYGFTVMVAASMAGLRVSGLIMHDNLHTTLAAFCDVTSDYYFCRCEHYLQDEVWASAT